MKCFVSLNMSGVCCKRNLKKEVSFDLFLLLCRYVTVSSHTPSALPQSRRRRTMLLPSLTLMLLTLASVHAQGPPGVPPRQQQFQQPPASQQQHHQHQQQQQFQQQQLNVQEGQGHGHGHGHGGNKLKFQSEIHNAE